jgi:hypothetical protein
MAIFENGHTAIWPYFGHMAIGPYGYMSFMTGNMGVYGKSITNAAICEEIKLIVATSKMNW